MARFLIGIDDTDNDVSPGTGQLARRLAGEAVRRGASHCGITRHQFLVDSRIPYTSHNSGACMAIEWPRAADELEFAMDLIGAWSASGSDPGVCIAREDAVPPAIVTWGERATREVLTMDEAARLAAAAGIGLRALGGSGQGIIGALGSVGLRAGGNEGRFLDLPGLRELGERVGRADLSRLGICVQHEILEAVPTPLSGATSTRDDAGEQCYDTLGWVRPRLVGGRPVLPVKWSSEHDAWIPVDQHRSRPLE